MRSPIERCLHVKYPNRIPHPPADLHLEQSAGAAFFGIQPKRLSNADSTCNKSPDFPITSTGAASGLFVSRQLEVFNERRQCSDQLQEVTHKIYNNGLEDGEF